MMQHGVCVCSVRVGHLHCAMTLDSLSPVLFDSTRLQQTSAATARPKKTALQS